MNRERTFPWKDIRSILEYKGTRDSQQVKYVTELKLLATNCNFGTLKDELIRDPVVYGINSDRINERLLGEEDLT